RRIKGVDAVIDKDFAGEKLAELVKADIFVSVTAVPNACVNFGTPEEEKLGEISVSEISKYLPEFKAGSMLPKVQAAMAFASKNKTGIITDIEHLKEALSGKAGTIIRR
ncbi:carbamate kinase, partial [Candidatus Saccharibacteria bacterium]|nr:carbamate kinase [Candidatus Saccharibacteria bacterium]